MYKELSHQMHEDGVLELSGVFAPDLAGQAAKFIKDFQALEPEDVQSRIQIDIEKATVRVDVRIPPTAGLPAAPEGFRPIDMICMTCEKHPWLEWPHDDCAGPGMPVSASLDIVRRLMQPDAPPAHIGELEPGPLTEVVGDAVDAPSTDARKQEKPGRRK